MTARVEPQQASLAGTHWAHAKALARIAHIHRPCSYAACDLCELAETSAKHAQRDTPIWPPTCRLRRGRRNANGAGFGSHDLQTDINTTSILINNSSSTPQVVFRYWIISLYSGHAHICIFGHITARGSLMILASRIVLFRTSVLAVVSSRTTSAGRVTATGPTTGDGIRSLARITMSHVPLGHTSRSGGAQRPARH